MFSPKNEGETWKTAFSRRRKMLAYHSVILEAYRAALADWAVKEIDGREMDQSLIHHTAAL